MQIVRSIVVSRVPTFSNVPFQMNWYKPIKPCRTAILFLIIYFSRLLFLLSVEYYEDDSSRKCFDQMFCS